MILINLGSLVRALPPKKLKKIIYSINYKSIINKNGGDKLKSNLIVFFVLVFFLMGSCTASSPQEVSDAIVTPDTQQYITEVGSKSGNDTQFQVYNQSLQGFPTNGSSFVVISSGNASGVNGTPSGISLFVGSGNSSTTGQYSNRNNFSYDIANIYFKINLPKGAKTLSFDWRFATSEAINQQTYWDWARAVITYAGQTYNILLLPDGNPVDVNKAQPYSNTASGNFTPKDVKYAYVTGNNQTPGIYHVTFDVSQWAGKEIELDFWVADENDGVVDSALFIDNLHITIDENNTVNAATVPMQKTGVPFGMLVVGILTILGGVIYNKKQ